MSAIDRLKKFYLETFPSAGYGLLDRSSAIHTTDVPIPEKGEHGSHESQRWSSESNSNKMSSIKNYPECSVWEWKLPESSHVMDEKSGVPFSHITLLCKHLICAKCNCYDCNYKHPGNVARQTYAAFSEDAQEIRTVCGSYAEGCEIPQYWVRNHSTGEVVRKRCDVDVMIKSKSNKIYVVGFHADSETNVNTIINTRFTKPGYLRLHSIPFINAGHQPIDEADYAFLDITFPKSSFSEPSDAVSYQNGPAMATVNCSYVESTLISNKFDLVHYLPCSVWPPQAESWIERERPSHWPTQEMVRFIVSQGCGIVKKAHPSSLKPKIEYRFSFSFAEVILFETLTVDQKDCFVSFKAIVENIVSSLKVNTKKELKITTYHLKTIFLWACESIDPGQWKTMEHWADCLFLLIDKLQNCVKNRFLPGYFIPECNLLDDLQHGNIVDKFMIKIHQFRLKPLLYAARLLDSFRYLNLHLMKISENIKILFESISQQKKFI